MDGLADSVPEGTPDDAFSYYSREPSTYDDPTVAKEDLWQVVVNPLLKHVLDWSTDFNSAIIRRGQLGVEGLVWVIDWFITAKGVEECLFEGKLGILMIEMEKL